MRESLQSGVYRLAAELCGAVREGKVTPEAAIAEMLLARKELLRAVTGVNDIAAELAAKKGTQK